MAKRLIVIPRAKSDIRAAYKWYEDLAPELGREFLNHLEATLGQIAQNPRLYPLRTDTFRRALLRRFPYAVYFDFSDEIVTVYYVFHVAQNPDRVAERLRRSSGS